MLCILDVLGQLALVFGTGARFDATDNLLAVRDEFLQVLYLAKIRLRVILAKKTFHSVCVI